MTTPDSTTDIEEFGIATYGINNNQGVTTTTELPRQEKNIKTLLQPDFSVDVLEEPAAEPISTNGAGWIPLNVDQILGILQLPKYKQCFFRIIKKKIEFLSLSKPNFYFDSTLV